MINNKKTGIITSSRRSVIMGGLALAGVAALSGCGSEDENKPKNLEKPVADGLPENILGDKNAPITLIEYSSMTCPHCASFHKNVLPTIKKDYIEKGHVKYIIREFPLEPLATAAFMLARCSGPEKYFPLVEVLYEHQASWATRNPVPKLMEYTKQAGFTKEGFEKCLKDKELEKKILKIREVGSKEYGVSSTPSFFVNGEKFNKSYTVESFVETFKSLLDKK